MTVPVGLNVWSRLVEELFPYLDQVVGPFESLWFPDHVQYEQHKVAEGWSLLAFASAGLNAKTLCLPVLRPVSSTKTPSSIVTS